MVIPDTASSLQIPKKYERVAEFYEHLKSADPAASVEDAWSLLDCLLANVEDKYGVKGEARMVIPLLGAREVTCYGNGGAMIALTGHYVFINRNGAIRIEIIAPSQIVMTKHGADGHDFVKGERNSALFPVKRLASHAPPLLQPVRNFVSANRKLGQVARCADIYPMAEGFVDMPPDPWDFFMEVFPFSDKAKQMGKALWTRVPVSQTVGSNWRWQPEDLDPAARPPLAHRLAGWQGNDNTELNWVEPLDIYFATNGQNRIALIEAQGISELEAFVSPWSYPAPEHVTIVKADGYRGDEYWAVLDGDWIEPIRHPAWVLPILKAYGVSSPTEWPADYPPFRAVVQALLIPLQHGDLPKRISLETLRRDLAKAAQLHAVSLFQVAIPKLDSKWKRMAVASGLLVGAAAGLCQAFDVPPEVKWLPFSMLLTAAAVLGVRCLNVAKP